MPISAESRRHDLIAAFAYAFDGLSTAWRTEPNLRIHAVIAAAVVVAGVLLRLPPLAWAILVLTLALVIAAELLNSAVESVVDLLSPDEHPQAKRAKDIAAAAVLIASVAAVAVGICLAVWALASR